MIRTVPHTQVVERFAVDGREFETREEAEFYDKGLKHFAEMLSGRFGGYHIPKGVTLDTVGTWLIRDEGPVDFGSQGSSKNLAAAHGTLRDAIKFACTEVKGFWGYGPGYIEVLNVVEV